MSKIDKDIMDKIDNRKFYLSKINANRIDEIPSKNELNISQDASYDIIENIRDKVRIKFKIKTFVKPSALFDINLEYIVDLFLNTPISDEEINGNINKLIASVGSDVSYTIAFITKEMINTRLILPPVNIEKNN